MRTQYEVSSIYNCRWFEDEGDAKAFFLTEKDRPHAGAMCVRIVSYPDGGEERTLLRGGDGRTPYHEGVGHD